MVYLSFIMFPTVFLVQEDCHWLVLAIVCDICGREYGSRSSLYVHRHRKHKTKMSVLLSNWIDKVINIFNMILQLGLKSNAIFVGKFVNLEGLYTFIVQRNTEMLWENIKRHEIIFHVSNYCYLVLFQWLTIRLSVWNVEKHTSLTAV